MSDPYAALGLAKGASEKDIRGAYRKLAKKYHPDHNPGDKTAEENFKAVNAAYSILGDKEKRERFDRGEIDAEGNERAPFGAGGFHPGAGGFSGGFGGQQFSQEDLGAFFSDMFAGGGGGGFNGGRRRPTRGADRSYTLDISFEDSVLGAVSRVTLPEAGAVEVRIPPGIEDGQTLRLAGKGGPGRAAANGGEAGQNGDALITIHVAPSPVYTREGRDLRAELGVNFRTAILGGKVVVPTPKGPVTMKVPAHSDAGTTLRLAGRGVAEHGGHKAGNLYVKLRIEIGKVDPALEAFLAREEVTSADV
ncbi:DnaJ C-terminal domain-containing protein [Acidomonas methanolica]|uniref:Heat shock protein DnaJ n=3 Tax=Acidomonas methanolica TaxID=437 RepID=A0A023D3E2_ACIMT|nr:J domain-containing protein [Acidomonas methanolica]MBU2654857.1 J domain-containing protein [Acidomonas methanolica]TCS24760.1 DnaJ-class molecular chaperone [Acidomonas methanolica]GAJ28270.1 heat shock protein DnaJ [Acidomonas methanolica NBRC 104435]GEK99838.1 molecular chaperone DnaJ [Acidomonas methanolica NBRC 104435]